MIWGGIQKTTLMDFPGRVSCILFTAGCNFECPYCHNPDLLKGGPVMGISEDEVMEFLKKRSGFLDGVVITGGEPTLQKDLADFCRQVREMGYAIKLDTNGSRPKALESILSRGLVDYVAMDLKTDPASYPKMCGARCEASDITQSVRVILDSGVNHEFRTTCARPLVDNHAIRKMGRLIRGAQRWVFQQCLPDHVLSPEFFGTDNPMYTADEVKSFVPMAAAYVEECTMRA